MGSFISKLVYSIGQKIFGLLIRDKYRKGTKRKEQTEISEDIEREETIQRISQTNLKAAQIVSRSYTIKRLLISSLILDYLILLLKPELLPAIGNDTLQRINDILFYSLIGISTLIIFKNRSERLLNKLLLPKNILLIIASGFIFTTLIKYIGKGTDINWIRLSIEILVVIFAVIPILQAIKKSSDSHINANFQSIIILAYFLIPLILLRIIHLGFMITYFLESASILHHLALSCLTVCLILAAKVHKDYSP